MREFDDNNEQNNGFYNYSTADYMNQMASNTVNTDSTVREPEIKHKAKKAKTVQKTREKNGGSGRFFKRATAIVASAAVFGAVSGGVFLGMTKNTIDDSRNVTESSSSWLDDELGKLDNGNLTGSDSTESENSQSTSIPAVTVNNSAGDTTGSLDVSDIAEGVMPSVVSITIKAVQEINQGIFGGTYQYEAEGSGSGIIIGENDSELLIVTNNHVVESADTVSVSFIDGQAYEAKVKGTDSDNDLAVIVVDLDTISADTLSQIKTAVLGSSDDLKVGEQVVAIGNALGYGQSVTTGIVSALNRVVDTNVTPLIQTDAAINPGNSGGALLNMKGELVGINSSKYASTDVEGMGYAIPLSKVQSIIDELMNRQTREKVDEENASFLGISGNSIDEQTSEAYGIPVGVYVSEVEDGSAADIAGIKEKCVITKFDGQTVSDMNSLTSIMSYYAAGEKVEVVIKVLQDNEYIEKTVSVTLGQKNSKN